ncbi:alanine aminotransferase 2 [Folsomia candida]|nr:alanine aminotransferase 2 [Folsomia candida]
MHLTNIDKGVHDVLHKLLTVQQCPSIVGQVGLYSLVSPPQNGEPSYDSFQREIADISHNYKQVAKILSTELNKVVGFNCSQPEGGPVVFTKFKIPQKAVDEAEVQGTAPDIFYGLELLETMGISVAVGSAFGLSPTQHYMRLSLPAKVEDIDKLVVRLKSFNQQFLEKYS